MKINDDFGGRRMRKIKTMQDNFITRSDIPFLKIRGQRTIEVGFAREKRDSIYDKGTGSNK
ncbi:MAG: hypothetical protein HRS57_03805 [Mycoplasmataceae bacterium]|nr:hypothetical protein [Mycoplasmataceae bacterium]